MPERPGKKKERDERGKRFSEELGLKINLKNEFGYLSDAKLIAMMNHNEETRKDHYSGSNFYYPVGSIDLEMMIREILRWRRGMLSRHEIKKFFANQS